MKIKYRKIGAKEPRIIEIADDHVQTIISRALYNVQVFKTPGHQYQTCLCHGCTLLRVMRDYVGTELVEAALN